MAGIRRCYPECCTDPGAWLPCAGVGIVATLFTPPGVAAILAVAVCVLAVTLRWWYVGVAFAVSVDVLTWSWVSWLKAVGNLTYWGAVLGIGAAFLLLARRSTVARWWLAAVGAVSLLLVVTAAWSFAPRTTVKETVVFAAALGVSGFAAAQLQSDPRQAGALVGALSYLVVAGLVLTALVVAFDHSAAVAQGGGVSGFINGPNTLGIWIALTFPFLLAQRAINSSNAAVLVTMGVLTFLMTLSGSRTGVVGLLLGFAAFELCRRQWRRLGVGTAAAAVAAAAAIAWTPAVPTLGAPVSPFGTTPAGTPSQASQLLGEGRPGNQSFFSGMVGARDEGWQEGLRLISKSPITGNGFGTGSLLFDHYGSRRRFHYFVGAFDTGVNVHNSYIQELDELGIVGGVLFLVPLFVALGLVVGRMRWGSGSTAEAAFSAVVVVAAFSAIFESILAAFGPMTLLAWLSVGAICALALARRSSPVPVRVGDTSVDVGPELQPSALG